MQTKYIGTTPVLLSNKNPNRLWWTLQFLPSSIVAGNTGKVFVGRGFVPNAVVGDPNMGQVLNSGSSIPEIPQYEGDPSVSKEAIWAVADTADQLVTYDEEDGI